MSDCQNKCTRPKKILDKHPDARRRYRVSFAGYGEFADDDSLTGTPTVTSIPAGITISDITVDDASAGKISFFAEGGTDGQIYELRVIADTVSTAVLARDLKMRVRS